MKKIKLPKDVDYIINTLNKEGYQANLVGGAVRDILMGKEPKDFDINTNALPEDIMKIFPRTEPTGLKHGTVSIILDGVPYEITTYRVDGEYKNHRRPENVCFIDDLKEDLSRRDFTINAMAYNHTDGLIDPFNGFEDLRNNIIKTPKKPEEILNQDPIRILRAYRFKAKYGLEFDKDLQEALRVKNPYLKFISSERIKSEIDKILMSDNPLVLRELLNYQSDIMPEFNKTLGFNQKNPYHDFTLDYHILLSVKEVDRDLDLRWTMLFHDLGKIDTFEEIDGIGHFYGHSKKSQKIAQNIMNRLKFSNKSFERISVLVLEHDREIEVNDRAIKRLMRKLGEDISKDLIKIKKADILSQKIYRFSDYCSTPRLTKLAFIDKKIEKILAEKQCYTIKDLDINGKDLIDLGYKEGKEIGVILRLLLEKVIENPLLNNRNTLVELVNQTLY